MRKGDIVLAPGWSRGSVFYKVRILGQSARGNVSVRWLTGPLKGREATLSRAGLKTTKDTGQ